MVDFQLQPFDARHLVGVSLETSHARAPQDIPAFWQRVMGEGQLAGVDSSEPGTIYAVYKDMEDEWRGGYTMMIALAVAHETATPEGLERVEIDAATRAMATLGDDKPETLMAAWHYVWHDWPDRQARAYGVDLEIYRPSADGQGREIELGLTMRQAG